jgi:hypothetical protein
MCLYLILRDDETFNKDKNKYLFLEKITNKN